MLREQSRDVALGDFDLCCSGARVGGARGLCLRRAPSANTQKPVLLASHPVRYEPMGQASRSAQALVPQLSESPPAEVK